MNLRNLKKIALLAVASLLLFPSCGEAQEVFAPDYVEERMPSDFFMTEQYAYFSEPITKDNSRYRRVVRMNLETGRVSCPCVDPLCAHDGDDCPLCGGLRINPILIFGDWLYFDSGTNRHERILYNLETGEWRDVFKETGGDGPSSSYIANIDSYLFHVAYLAKEKEGVAGEYEYSTVIRRYDLVTGSEKEIYSADDMINIHATSSTRIYFGSDFWDEGRITYSIDTDGNNLREEPNFVCGIPGFLYSDTAYYFDSENRFYFNNLKTGETGRIIDDMLFASAIYVSEQHIYYVIKDRSEERMQLRYEDYRTDMQTYNKLLNEFNSTTAYIWRCDHDGGNKEMVFEFPGANFNMIKVHGNYIYTVYNFYDPDTHTQLGTKAEQNSFCRINLETGETVLLPRSDADLGG